MRDLVRPAGRDDRGQRKGHHARTRRAPFRRTQGRRCGRGASARATGRAGRPARTSTRRAASARASPSPARGRSAARRTRTTSRRSPACRPRRSPTPTHRPAPRMVGERPCDRGAEDEHPRQRRIAKPANVANRQRRSLPAGRDPRYRSTRTARQAAAPRCAARLPPARATESRAGSEHGRRSAESSGSPGIGVPAGDLRSRPRPRSAATSPAPGTRRDDPSRARPPARDAACGTSAAEARCRRARTRPPAPGRVADCGALMGKNLGPPVGRWQPAALGQHVASRSNERSSRSITPRISCPPFVSLHAPTHHFLATTLAPARIRVVGADAREPAASVPEPRFFWYTTPSRFTMNVITPVSP